MALSNSTPEQTRLCQEFERLKLLRSSEDSILYDTQRYTRPNGSEFNNSGEPDYKDGSSDIYDDTAVWACQMFANGMTGNLIPKSDQWAFLRVKDVPIGDMSDEQLIWLEQVRSRMFHEFALTQSQFYSSGHEMFMDLGSYGNAPVQVSKVKGIVNFKTRPLQDLFFDEDEEGVPNVGYYRKWYSGHQLVKLLPEVATMEGFNDKDPNKKYQLIYACEPSTHRAAKVGGRVGNERPFIATFFSPDFKEPIRQGHMDYFPFLIPRWAKRSGSVYGRGPAASCIAQIRALNKMMKEVLISSEQLNAPPLVAEEDSIMLPLEMGARKVMFHEPGSPAPAPLQLGNQPNYMLEMINMLRDSVIKSFFVDQILRDQKKERQSILEIQDHRGQMLQQISPLLSRVESEYLTPSLELTYMLLDQMDQIPAPPDSLRGIELEPVFTSPASQAQFASRIGDISSFFQDVTPLASVDPTIMEAVKIEEMFRDYARYRNINPKNFRDKKELEELREQRKQQEQMAQMTASAPEIAGSIKDMALAKQADPEGTGELLNLIQ